jgi:outer membrane protein assembly factor BamB
MDFSQEVHRVEAEFRRLKGQFEAGALTEDEFKARLADLMIQDEKGRWWMIGYETGKWYYHDGEKWVRGEPPQIAEPPAAPIRRGIQWGWPTVAIVLLISLLGMAGFLLVKGIWAPTKVVEVVVTATPPTPVVVEKTVVVTPTRQVEQTYEQTRLAAATQIRRAEQGQAAAEGTRTAAAEQTREAEHTRVAVTQTAFAVMAEATRRANAKVSVWPMAGHDSSNTYWNREESILYPPLHVIWQYRPSGNIDYFESATIGSGKVLLSGTANEQKSFVVVGLDADNGDELWRFDLTGGGGAMGIKPAIYGGLGFFGGQGDDNLYAVDIQTGQLRWKKSGMVGMFDRDPIVDHGILYVSTWGGEQMSIMALRPETGDTLWELPGESKQSDYVSEDGKLMRGGGYGEQIIGIDVGSGKIAWKTKGRSNSYLAAGDGLVFAAYTGDSPVELPDYPNYVYDRLAAFSVRDGGKTWETTVDADLTYGQLALVDNALYLLTWKREQEGSKLYVFEPTTGKSLSQRSFGTTYYHMVGANQVVYLCGKGLEALQPRDLNTLWSAEIGGCDDISIAGGNLYVVQPWSEGLTVFGR